MIQDGSKENAITILAVYKMVTMIMNYLNDSNHYSLDEDKLKNSGILDDFIYQIIFSLVHTCYLNACKPSKKLLLSFEICLSNWK